MKCKIYPLLETKKGQCMHVILSKGEFSEADTKNAAFHYTDKTLLTNLQNCLNSLLSELQ